MSIGDWIQAISLLLVAFTLLLGFFQLREIDKQSTLSVEVIERTSYDTFKVNLSDHLWLREDPELVEWHLRIRGYPLGSLLENKKTLLLLNRLENHEENVMKNDQRTLDPELWEAWKAVISTEVALPEFRALWSAAKPYFARTLVKMVDEAIRSTSSSQVNP
jgi:hypothetical protein